MKEIDIEINEVLYALQCGDATLDMAQERIREIINELLKLYEKYAEDKSLNKYMDET